MWDLEQQHFQVGTHILTLDVEDIYFLTGISRHGSHVSFFGPRGGDMTIYDLMDQYCTIDTFSQSGNIVIKHVMGHPPRTILFTIEKVVCSRASH